MATVTDYAVGDRLKVKALCGTIGTVERVSTRPSRKYPILVMLPNGIARAFSADEVEKVPASGTRTPAQGKPA